MHEGRDHQIDSVVGRLFLEWMIGGPEQAGLVGKVA